MLGGTLGALAYELLQLITKRFTPPPKPTVYDDKSAFYLDTFGIALLYILYTIY